MMNFLKITKYGAVLNKFRQSLSALRTVNNEIRPISLPNAAFFSHFCNSFRCGETSKLIQTPVNPLKLCSRGLKIRGHLQLRCKNCYFARKDGEMYVLCSTHPRHKQKKLTKRTKYSWILTYAFQGKSRPY